MTKTPNNPPKLATPVKIGSVWRIKRDDGELVGYYATKALAQAAIDKAWYLH